MHRILRLMATLVLAFLAVVPARADVLTVPESVRRLREPHEEVHALRALDGTRLGEQRSRAVVQDDRLLLDLVTDFANGEHWDENAELDLAQGYRARSFQRIATRGGQVFAEQHIDFSSGEITWVHEGSKSTRTLPLPSDTYLGPMYGVVLAAVPERPLGSASLHTVVFSPDPTVYELRADVVDKDNFRVENVSQPTTKIRLKANLGPVQNVVFASLIPTHYFWFTRATPPAFYAFEGALGYGGPALRMIPERRGAATTGRDHVAAR